MIKRKKGMTFIELIAAVSIVVIGALIVIRLEPVIYNIKEKIDQNSTMVFLAVNKIEELRAQVLYKYSQSIFDGDYTEEETALPEPYADYRYTISDTTDEPRILQLNVWHTDKPNNKFVLDTMVARRT